MQKPNNFNETQGYSDFSALEPGGYVCKIIKVEETVSSTNKNMLKIFLDIAEGDEKAYYSKQYKADTRDEKKWGCIVSQTTEDNDGNCSRGFKTFIEAVAASNHGFNPDTIWGNDFPKHFKDRLVGGLFRREQYENKYGELKWSTKCFTFKPIDVIRAGVDVPEDKYLTKNAPTYRGYRELDDSDGELPL